MLIVIRGQKVKTQLVSKTLAHRLKDTYKPLFLPRPLKITFGYNTKSKEHYGLMMYHKNRLIKAYERVGCQLKANRTGVGIIGVIECDFLQPTHNKQDFDATDEYRKTLYNVGIKLEDYWKEVHHRLRSTVPVEDIQKRPDQNWVQCNSCLKWRKLPDGIDTDKLPESWFCHMNYDPQFRSCTVEQEQEDSDDEQTRYQNTYKQQCVKKHLLSSFIIKCLIFVMYYLIFVCMCNDSEKKKKLQEDRYRQQVKTERRLSEDQPELRMECNDDAAIDNSTTTEATDLANSSPPDKVSITTQTEREQAVKKEEENSGEQREQNDKKDRGSTKQGAAPAERRTNEGQEASGSIQEPPGDQVRRVTRLENGNGEANQVKSEGDPPLDSLSSESQNLSVLEAQEQQDNLLELLEVASRERDESRAQAQLLTSQVEELQSSLHELTEKMLKKEQCQQSTQTDAKQEEEKEGEGEDKQDYKALRDVSAGVNHLMRELDEKNKAQEDLKNKVSGQIMSYSCMLCCYVSAAAAGPSNQEKLRQKVGRLLVTFVPALDLEQVNYDCDVIDEILNQVVEEIFGATAAS
uniref:CW-type domain-containing protein n=1 Tax=Astyanax mexicanus TaxID=7994 RepID=W5K3H9_ASTMX